MFHLFSLHHNLFSCGIGYIYFNPSSDWSKDYLYLPVFGPKCYDLCFEIDLGCDKYIPQNLFGLSLLQQVVTRNCDGAFQSPLNCSVTLLPNSKSSMNTVKLFPGIYLYIRSFLKPDSSLWSNIHSRSIVK